MKERRVPVLKGTKRPVLLCKFNYFLVKERDPCALSYKEKTKSNERMCDLDLFENKNVRITNGL